MYRKHFSFKLLAVCLVLVSAMLLCSCNLIFKPETSADVSSETSVVSDASSVSEAGTSSEESAVSEVSDVSEPASEPVSEPVSEEESEEDVSFGEVTFRREGQLFEDLEYVRPDFDAIAALIKNTSDLFKANATAEEVDAAATAADDAMMAAQSQSTLLSLTLSLDTTRTELSDELILISEEYSKLVDDYFEMLAELVGSYCDEIVFADWTEEDKQEIINYARSLDEEYTAIQKRITEIENRYKDNFSIKTKAYGDEMTLLEVYEKYGESGYAYALNKEVGNDYLELISLYKQIGKKFGSDDYVAYAYENVYYRDFTPEDTAAFREFAKEYIYPVLVKAVSKIEYYEGSVPTDLSVYDEVFKRHFNRISPDMYEAYEFLKEYNLRQAGSADTMEDGAYTTFLHSFGLPVIYQKTSGSYSDITTFVHEFGHFYADYLYGEDMPSAMDICEIHSQADELLFLRNFKDIFGEEAYDQISDYEVTLTLYTIITSCVFDEFEEKAFASNATTVAELNTIFKDICSDYGLNFAEYYWCTVQHFFVAPIYYISYATSVVPALQIYSASLENYKDGVAMYNRIIDNTIECEGFLDLLKKAEFSSPFEEETIKTIAEAIDKQVN